MVERYEKLVRLPLNLSDLIDHEVRAFVEARKEESLQSINRYQDADLWLIFNEESVVLEETQIPGILQVRIHLAALEGESNFYPDLVYTPDKLIMTSSGRYILPSEIRKAGQITQSLSGFGSNTPKLVTLLRNNLGLSWENALSIPLEQVREIIP